MNLHEGMPLKKEFISDKNKPLIPQLIDFVPDKNPDFTALKYLTNPKDIENYFNERIAQVKEINIQDQNPTETVRSELAYIAGYGEEFQRGWIRFKKIIGFE